jgi:hypothetical protein
MSIKHFSLQKQLQKELRFSPQQIEVVSFGHFDVWQRGEALLLKSSSESGSAREKFLKL